MKKQITNHDCDLDYNLSSKDKEATEWLLKNYRSSSLYGYKQKDMPAKVHQELKRSRERRNKDICTRGQNVGVNLAAIHYGGEDINKPSYSFEIDNNLYTEDKDPLESCEKKDFLTMHSEDLAHKYTKAQIYAMSARILNQQSSMSENEIAAFLVRISDACGHIDTAYLRGRKKHNQRLNRARKKLKDLEAGTVEYEKAEKELKICEDNVIKFERGEIL